MIKCYSSEDTFVETDVIPIALDDLEAKGITVITGTAGSGKSRNSLEILRRFSAGHEMYCGIQLDNISEWNDIINHDDSLIVVLDDVFGKSNCIFNAEDENIFDKIYSTIVQGCVKVIFTLRNTIKSNTQVSDIINRQRVFQKSRFINLDSADIEMDEEQRRECLLKYCKSNKIRIASTEYLLKDKHSSDQSVPISLSLMETYEIAKTDVNPLKGYPQSCYLFTSNREFTQQGVGFFKHPTQSLCNEIESLRTAGNSNEEEALQYTILVYMALNEDLLDLQDIKLQTFNKIHELIYRKKEFTTQNIRRPLGQLTMRYLRINPNGTYSFQHRSIFEGVLLSYKDIEAKNLIPLLHIDFILEIGRLDENMTQPGLENEITLVFRTEDFKLLAHKIIAELQNNDSPQTFMERFCSSRILRNADRYFLDEILKEYMLSKCEMFCRLRNLDSEIGYRRFNEQILGVYFKTSKRTSVTFLTCLLKYSIKYADNNDTIRHILKLIEQDLNIYKTSYINITHEQCFTEAILQSCVYLDSIKLKMILKFAKKNKIRLDEQLIGYYDFDLKCGFNIDRKIAAIKLLSHTFLTDNLIDSNHILEKVINANDTSLVELFFKEYRQYDPIIDVPFIFYYACAKGASSIVQWFFSNFPQKEFNVSKALLAACICGRVESPVASSSFQDEHLKDSGKVVLFLLNNFRTKINNLDTAMYYALSRSEFNTCRILMDNTDNYFGAKEVLLGIARYTTYAYQRTDACFDFVKYLVTDYSCPTVEIVLNIAEKFDENLNMVEWIMRKTQTEIFHTAWKKHKWIHKKLCALKLIYDTEFYKTLTVTNLIEEELQYGNNDCLRFLIEKIDIEKAVNVIFEKVCSCGDENLMQMIFEKYRSLNIVDAMNIALKNRNWEAVQWLCKNYDIEKLNFRAIMEEAITYGPISVIRYLTEIIDRKYFNSRDILLALEREELFMDENDCELLIKWYLQDSQNRYRINDMLKLSCMKKQIYTQVLFNVLFQNRKNEFLHLHTALETLLVSQDFDSLKKLLCTYDTNIFDMNMLMNCILGIFRNRTNADSIPVWLLQTFDPILFDIPYILEKTCSNDNVEFVKWMDRQYEFSNLTLESVFINAYKYSAISVLKWVFGKINFPISFKKVIKNVSDLRMSVVIFLIQNFELDRSDIDQICRIYSSEEVDQLEVQLCIFEAYGSRLVDIKSVFDSVCRLSSIEEVKWFIRIVDNNLLNFFSAI
ncbi:uncharacterized protein LOC134718679 [Mytilus trossulus]|uniref:uncharacterized protein LOC134718679 n=1 Tax=Mytilus trossulus TaxID=6551 RepID=UPI0030044B61